MRKGYLEALLVCLASSIMTVNAVESSSVLQKEQWIHGSIDCKTNTDPSLDVYAHDSRTYILRQNKCDTFEAPFLYLLIGEKQVMLLDTGAVKKGGGNQGRNLYEEVQSLIGEKDKPLVVLHSHGHSDHTAGDRQFQTQSGVTLVAPQAKSIRQFFGFNQWPDGEARLDLGRRELRVFPVPGHQEESIAVYDSHTGWLMTGDTVYPGYIYVKRWQSFRDSIARMVAFTETNEVTAIMGAHIEMKAAAGEFYPVGTLYQPEEAILDLPVSSLVDLHQALQAQQKPAIIEQDRLIVAPMGTVRKGLSNMVRWLRGQ